MIGFDPTPGQRELRERARAFVEREIEPRRERLDDDDDFPREIFERAHAEGLLTDHLPEADGGRGRSLLDTAFRVEEIAYGDLGVATSMFVGILACGPIVAFGTPAQKVRWLRPLVDAPRFCSYAWTEPEGSTSLLARPAKTTARRCDGGYRLDGEKCFITNAPVADYFVVFANREPGPDALTCLIVPADSPGVRVTRPYRKMGQRASVTGGIRFEDVFVPEENRIGDEGHGPRLALAALSRSRAGVGAMAVGVARAARDRVVEWGHRRETSRGRPLVLEQDYRFRLAEMDLGIETARLLAWRACWEADHGEALPRFASAAKWYGARTAVEITGMAVEMLGGHGYMRDGRVEKLMRDAKLLEIYEGPPAVQKMLLAEYATKRSAARRPAPVPAPDDASA